jgi:hypothetical protein
VENVMHDSLETQAILQRMEEVRCDVDEDVQEIVEGARDMGKWRYYVRTYPWICLGAALAVGYVIVPRRAVGTQSDAHKPDELDKPNSPPKDTARGILLAFVGNLVMRGAAAYVGQQAAKLFASETVKAPREGQP